jgi:D-amino peptidase
LTTLETNAAIEGALEAGATEFLVIDGHGHGAIAPKLLHPAATLLTGRPLAYPFLCDRSFDAAMVVGQHAKSNADGGHLSHSESFEMEDITLNGRSLGELGLNMLFCSYFDVPTVLVTGDAACAEEATTLVPNVETATVKWGWKRGSATGLTGDENMYFNGAATHLSPEKARDVIREAARRALQRRAQIECFRMEPPYELVYSLRRTESEPAKRAAVNGADLIEVLNTPPQYLPLQ